MSLTAALDAMTLRLFGHRLTDAQALRRCVKCWRKVGPEHMEPLDRIEWYLSGFCPDCYAELPSEDAP